MTENIITYEYIRGYADRASQVHLASRSILMTSKKENEPLMRDIYLFLTVNKFHCSWVTDRDRCGIRISGKQSLIKWRDCIGMNDKEKAKKLELLIDGGPDEG